MFKLALLLFLFSVVYPKSIPKHFAKPEEGDLFEGDIKGVDFKGANQIPTASRLKWNPIENGKGALVPYNFGANYSQAEKDVILSGLKMIEDMTRVNNNDCVKFVPIRQNLTSWVNEQIYINIKNDTGCFSWVGKNKYWGAQDLSLSSPRCITPGIVAHEFIHALGFWHEQSRPDRDMYVNINYQNIQPGTEHNFQLYTVGQVDYLKQPYDYGSIMHYGELSFSVNGKPTIQPRNRSAIIGQRKALSPIDVKEIQIFYDCI